MKTTRLRARLRDVTPDVVRVLDLPTASTLSELHDLLQVGIGWTDRHLHVFDTGDIRYGVPNEDDPGLQDESARTLRDLPPRFTYLYDFGDGWEHDVEVIGSGGPEPGCVYGEGACPPEDCGGPGGYADLLTALADPDHPEHDAMRQWSAGWVTDFDQEATDRIVREIVGRVPASVRLVLGLLEGGVRLTPGGRLPRALVRQIQEERPGWALTPKPAAVEEDLPPLTGLHVVLRQAGLARLSRGVLTPTRAADDDLQSVRRLRRVFPPDTFYGMLVAITLAELVARGPRPLVELADAVHPHFSWGWAADDAQLTDEDIRGVLTELSFPLRGLDLVVLEGWSVWHPGPSATTLLPRATALAQLWRRRDTVR